MSRTPPAEFAGVTAICKANIYFDGKVASHTLCFADGSKKTLGLVCRGEFHFGIEAPERIEIVSGTCKVKLDGSDAWQSYAAGASFRVPGQSGFTIAVESGVTEYVCSFE